MFFLEQGALDYITRLEAQGKPEALTRGDCEAADGVTAKELEHATSGAHSHVQLAVLDAPRAAHMHTKFCAHHAATPVPAACGGCEHDHTHLNLLDAAQAAHTHTHLCAGGKDTAPAKGSEALQTPSRQVALCLSLELSIVVHSVIIGCACTAPAAVPNVSRLADAFNPLVAHAQVRARHEPGQLIAGGPGHGALLPPVFRGPRLGIVHWAHGQVRPSRKPQAADTSQRNLVCTPARP
jgi:hypothetical protein